MDPVDVTLGAGIFPVARPVPAYAGPDVAGVVIVAIIVVEVGDPALVAAVALG